ncbi:non-homologous end-joining DNA ligase [Streptomyces sp. TP-A0874]|uniref:non-homologous end-joining DNA ligase n=1 Tax=Streptomyces sp. TP-A0874 TaxID=549819 RepID=UPI0008532B3C|nr:non-homologous end-joining DNA ligase [Streptomyces sp. TP-A0874]
MSDQRTVRIGKRTIEISRPDKVLFPDDGITKSDLVDHYRRVARRMVPQLRGRPLMMLRHPDGIAGEGIVQKNAPAHFPDWVRLAELPKQGGTVTHVLCEDAATLVFLADQACITPHRWLSRADRPNHPDRLVYDLDPSDGTGFPEVRWAAQRLCGLLDGLGLPTQLMTTGSRGLHVIVPLDRRMDFDGVRAFARDTAELLAGRHPDRLTTEPAKADRGARVYLDTQRNAYAQTAVAPYAVRAIPGAPVAMPITREELDDPGLDARRWTMAATAERLDQADPWGGMPRRGRSLHSARSRLAEGMSRR